MFYAYVIQSLIDPLYFYKGHCQNLDERLSEHNYKMTKSNKHKAPFKVVYFESLETLSEALVREKYFKTSAGRRFLKLKISEL